MLEEWLLIVVSCPPRPRDSRNPQDQRRPRGPPLDFPPARGPGPGWEAGGLASVPFPYQGSGTSSSPLPSLDLGSLTHQPRGTDLLLQSEIYCFRVTNSGVRGPETISLLPTASSLFLSTFTLSPESQERWRSWGQRVNESGQGRC